MDRRPTSLSLETILQALEREREAQWDRRSQPVQLKLHWRAQVVKHGLHVLPGESILELGGGSGRLAERIQRLLGAENPLTIVVFSRDFYEKAMARGFLA